jgi:hypothetical protein
MRRPGGYRAAQDQELDGSGVGPATSSIAWPSPQVLTISASGLTRDQLLGMANACMVEARKLAPSPRLETAAIALLGEMRDPAVRQP